MGNHADNFLFQEHTKLLERYKDLPWDLDKENISKQIPFVNGSRIYIEGHSECQNGDQGKIPSLFPGEIIAHYIVKYNKKHIPNCVFVYDVDKNHAQLKRHRKMNQFQAFFNSSLSKPDIVCNLTDEEKWSEFQNEKDGSLVINEALGLIELARDITNPERCIEEIKRNYLSDAFDMMSGDIPPLMVVHDKLNKTDTEIRYR